MNTQPTENTADKYPPKFLTPAKMFCRKCGSKLEDTECGYFDEYTGLKIHKLICPNVSCEAYCDFWGHEYTNRSWLGYRAECKNCGYIPD